MLDKTIFVVVAAADGNIDALHLFDDIPYQLTPEGNTVPHIAVPHISSLLQQPNKKGDTPLHLAAREGHLTAVKNMIAATKQIQGGAAVCEVMLRMSNEEGDTALHEAVRYHHSKVVKLLIEDVAFYQISHPTSVRCGICFPFVSYKRPPPPLL